MFYAIRTHMSKEYDEFRELMRQGKYLEDDEFRELMRQGKYLEVAYVLSGLNITK